MEKVRIAVLCSGGGTNLQAILDAQAAGKIPHGEVVLVIADSREAFALERAKRCGVETAVFDKKEYPRAERERATLAALKGHRIGLVVLAGFLTVLSPAFVGEYAGRIVNIHPALLPSFGGVGMYGLHVHEAVLARGCHRAFCHGGVRRRPHHRAEGGAGAPARHARETPKTGDARGGVGHFPEGHRGSLQRVAIGEGNTPHPEPEGASGS